MLLPQYAAYATLLLFSLAYKYPQQLLFSLAAIFFSPVWIHLVKFGLSILKNKKSVILPKALTYAIAFATYIYLYGFSIQNILIFIFGFCLSYLVIFLCEYVYKDLDEAGVKSYRKKAFYSWAVSSIFGILLLLLFRLYFNI